jgi:ubiquitin carboxyl-terminal hydrolase 8
MTDVLSDTSSTALTIYESESKEPELSVEDQRKKYLTRGLTGLINLGNTCYMNAAMQCLLASGLFVAYFRNGTYKNDLKYGIIREIYDAQKKSMDGKDGDTVSICRKKIKKMFRKSITYKFRNVIVIAWGKNCKIKMKSFKAALGASNPTFAGYSQNDSQEFVGFLLDRIHEETKTDIIIEFKDISANVLDFIDIKEQYNKLVDNDDMSIEDKIKHKENFTKYRNEHLAEDAIYKSLQFWQKFLKKNHSAIIDIFTGLHLNTVKCEECETVAFSFQPENSLTLGIGSGYTDISIYDCLSRHFTQHETLTGDNAYHCSNCDKKTTALKKVFNWHAPPILIIQLKRFFNMGAMLARNNRIVDFPLNDLDMGQYSSEYNKREQMYDLYGVVHQMGSLHGGHYIAYTKNPINGMWYRYDDDDIVHIDESRIKDIMQTKEAYLLFYKKREDSKITSFGDDAEDFIDLT